MKKDRRRRLTQHLVHATNDLYLALHRLETAHLDRRDRRHALDVADEHYATVRMLVERIDEDWPPF